MEDPLRIMTKYPKKVEQGYRLAEWNHKNKEKLAQETKAQSNEACPDEAQESNLSYGIGTVIVIGMLGLLGYYISKKGDKNDIKVISVETQKCASLKWSDLPYYKISKTDKKSIVNDLYQAAVISVFTVGYPMLGKKIPKMTPPGIQKFDLEDTGKLVAVIASSEMMREYPIKQKIVLEHINVHGSPLKWLSGIIKING